MSNTQQPEALRLADALEKYSLNSLLSPLMELATELRRQHARIEELEAQLSEYRSELKTKEVHTDSERRNAIAKLLGLGDVNFAWSYLHDQIKDLVKCEEELIALRKQVSAPAPEGAVPQWDGKINPADFNVEIFRRSGNGWLVKPDNCVRITHRPTGFFEEENAMRSAHANKAVAWQRLSDRLESLAAAAPQPPDTTAAWVRPVSELLGHISDVLPDNAFDKIDTAKWNAVSALVGAGGVEPLRKQAAETSNDILTMADALIIQRTADARDAARYRWLRDNDWRNDEKMEPVIRLHLNAIWDEKIDAAMAAQARNKKGIEQ